MSISVGTHPKYFEDVFMYGEIPSGVFTNATNLKSIILPKKSENSLAIQPLLDVKALRQ